MRQIACLAVLVPFIALGQSTFFIGDVNTTPSGSSVRALSAAEGRAYFSAFSATTGHELYRTDGSLATTTLITDATVGTASSTIDWTYTLAANRAYVKHNGRLMTTTGNNLIEIVPTVLQPLGHVGTTFYFTRGTTTAPELWRTTGSSASAVQIPLAPGTTELTAIGSAGTTFYFYRNRAGLFRTDGTTAVQMSSNALTTTQPIFAASATTGIMWFGSTLLRLDPVAHTLVSVGVFLNVSAATMLGDTAIFAANTTSPSILGSDLYRLIPGAMNPVMIFNPGSNRDILSNFVSLPGIVVFKLGSALYATNGTTVTSLQTLTNMAGPYGMPGVSRAVAWNPSAVNSRYDMVYTDGTVSGTTNVTTTLNLLTPVSAGTTVYATTPTGDLVSTQSAGPPIEVATTYIGTRPLTGAWFVNQDESVALVDSRSALLTGRVGEIGFLRSNSFAVGTVGNQFFGSFFGEPAVLLLDGGVAALGDFTPGTTTTRFSDVTANLGAVTLFIASTTTATDFELCRTDGTIAGTIPLLDLNAGPAGSEITSIVVSGARGWFSANDGLTGRELWLSDGSVMGTRRVVDLSPGLASSSPLNLAPFRGGVLFSATTTTSGREAWFSDGTAAGTVMLVDSAPGSDDGVTASATFCEVATLGAFFVANGSLYRTDGTPGGTQLVGPAPDDFVCSADHLVQLRDGGVVAFDGVQTRPVGPVPVPSGFRVEEATSVGTTVFFRATTSLYGSELWKSSVVDGGMALIADIAPFNRPGVPNLQTLRLRDRLLFLAASDGVDTEPWAHLLDGTRPTVTPSISGPMGLNGWYVGDISVSFTVTEPESRLARANCGVTQVTVDTPSRAITCRAISEGGETSSTVTVKRDATAPVSPVLSSPVMGASVNTRRPALSLTVSEGGALRVVSDGGTVCSATPTSAGLVACSPTNDFAEGAVQLSFTLTDEAGNVSAPSSGAFIIDTVSPASPTIVTPAAMASVNALSFSGAAEPSSTVTVVDAAMTTLCTARADAAGQWSCSVSAPGADRPLTVTARATDAAGNDSAPSPSLSVTLDTLAPLAPLISMPSQAATIGTGTPTVLGTAEAGSTVRVYVDGSTSHDCATLVPASSIFSCTLVTPLSNGPHTVVAESLDLAGNASPRSLVVLFTVSTQVPPTPSLTSPVPGALLNVARPIFSGGSSMAASVSVSVDGAQACVATPGPTGEWSCPAANDLGEGAHEAVARALSTTSVASATSAAVRFTIDTVAPGTPEIVVPLQGAMTGPRPTFSGTAEPSARVALTVDGAAQPTCETTASGSGSWSCAGEMDLMVGQHTVQARATDAAGNASAQSGVRLFTVQSTLDTRAPELTCPSDITAQASGTGSAIVNFQATVRDDNDPSPALRFSQVSGTDFPVGDTEVQVTATDASGNTAQCAFLVKVGESSERNTVRSGCRCSGAGADVWLLGAALGLFANRRRRRRSAAFPQ